MASFLELRFPTLLAALSHSDLVRRTEIAQLGSGAEERNAVWQHSRRRYQVGDLIKSRNEAYAVIDLFEAANGRLKGFRFKDVLDYRSGPPQDAVTPLDQAIGLGDGATATWQLIKTYPSGYVRSIQKPVVGSVRVAVAGVEQSIGTQFTVNTTTGEITFTAGNVPLGAITAGFEFDVPVRFDADQLTFERQGGGSVSAPDVALLEIRVNAFAASLDFAADPRNSQYLALL